ncbi:hypothetical protein [Pseudoalteromonas luteoviolacea]|uniref:hypothetical protein n=1 Tax=Pseudoalteromonas luteoviolacea TaxID=43657 RepID=UPI001B37C709|nr:hypothetical protein [Pseudoalteromonas luteoviolacea]MBQ4839600.1 hypothetical protein [Pseudoalteromonas luteoviolacea]
MTDKILEKFTRKRKQALKYPQKYLSVFEENKKELFHYIEHGCVVRGNVENEHLPFLPWELFTTEIQISADYYAIEAQCKYLQNSQFSIQLVGNCLSYAYLDCILSYCRLKRYVTRFGREHERAILSANVLYLVMAVILQQPERAEHIFKLLQVGYPKNWIIRSKSHIGDFIILLFDAVKGGKQLVPIVDDFAYADIVARWDTDDLQELTGYLTQLCDDQVAQVASPPSKMYFEFDNMNWQFTPYAALLLLALRAERGLPNPDFSHPGFGNITQLLLEEPVAPVEDELLSQLLACIRDQGFDEEALMNA